MCKFEVDAWDGSYPGVSNTTGDAFGLHIYACQTVGDRYKILATNLLKGSIIIHKK